LFSLSKIFVALISKMHNHYGNHYDSDETSAAGVTEECLTSAASSLLFFVSGALLIGSAVFYALTDVMARKSRLFHHLITAALATSALSYLAQAYGIGVSSSDGRCLFNLRYLELALTTPLLLSALGLLAGTSFSEIFLASSASALMFLAQWAGVLLPTRAASWLLFGFSALMWLPVLRTLFVSYIYDSRKHQESATTAGGPLTDKLRSTVIATSLLLGAFTLLQHLMYFLSGVLGKVEDSKYLQTMAVGDLITKVLVGIALLSQRDMLEWRSRFIRSGQSSPEEGGILGTSRAKYSTFGETTGTTA